MKNKRKKHCILHNLLVEISNVKEHIYVLNYNLTIIFKLPALNLVPNY